MSMKDRKTLKNLFKKGSVPTEAGFSDLIDSNINKIDDGISKTVDQGLMLAPIGDSKKVLSIYDKIAEKDPTWSVELKSDEKTATTNNLNLVHESRTVPNISLNEDGQVGIQKTDPRNELDVNGFVASKGRLGRYTANSEVDADGQWHTIIDGLNHCQGFEVIARTGIHKSGKHAMVHAIALSAYGHSHSKIKCNHARFSFWRPLRIKLRWTGSTYNYQLQIKSSKDLGVGVKIKYYITQLWDDYEMGITQQFKDQ